jgi:hypothetical protein
MGNDNKSHAENRSSAKQQTDNTEPKRLTLLLNNEHVRRATAG